MIPGGDPAPPRGVGKDCTSCRLLGFGILTGTGFYTIYSALYAPDASSSPLPSSSSTGTSRATSNTAAHSTAVTSQVRKDVVAGQKIPLGLNTRGFGQHNGMGRGLLAGFGARTCYFFSCPSSSVSFLRVGFRRRASHLYI
ncbi:hypothetical protein DL93DRAFT_2072554 [Clavulina sp. PMI_390]|nr:hypothetical protein DL93DRAFT_2072554 [Clavulina sp. PMI_390]